LDIPDAVPVVSARFHLTVCYHSAISAFLSSFSSSFVVDEESAVSVHLFQPIEEYLLIGVSGSSV